MQIVTTSLVDEAESEIWLINQIQFSFLLAISNCLKIICIAGVT